MFLRGKPLLIALLLHLLVALLYWALIPLGMNWYRDHFGFTSHRDIGLGIARIHVNDDVKKRQRLVNQVNGIDDYDNPLYQPLQDTEYNAELYYGVHVTDWLTVRPNLQYIKQPGGVDEVDNALVAGIKIQTVF